MTRPKYVNTWDRFRSTPAWRARSRLAPADDNIYEAVAVGSPLQVEAIFWDGNEARAVEGVEALVALRLYRHNYGFGCTRPWLNHRLHAPTDKSSVLFVKLGERISHHDPHHSVCDLSQNVVEVCCIKGPLRVARFNLPGHGVFDAQF